MYYIIENRIYYHSPPPMDIDDEKYFLEARDVPRWLIDRFVLRSSMPNKCIHSLAARAPGNNQICLLCMWVGSRFIL